MEEPIISQAKNSDLEEIRLLAEKSLSSYTLSKEKLSAKSSEPDFVAVKAALGNRIIGFVMGSKKNEKIFHIWLLGVDPDFRKIGVGKKMLSFLHSLLSKKGYSKIDTLTFNKYVPKIILSLKCGYSIKDVKFIREKNDFGIFLEKVL